MLVAVKNFTSNSGVMTAYYLLGGHQRSEHTAITFNLYSATFLNIYQTTRCQNLEHKAIKMLLLQWFDWNLSDYFGPTISDLGWWEMARAAGHRLMLPEHAAFVKLQPVQNDCVVVTAIGL
jgi:hypothetical protein